MDIEEDKEALLALDHVDDSSWSIMFDPHAFCKENEELKLQNFRLNEKQLLKYATTVCSTRTKIIDKSQAIKTEDVEAIDESSSSAVKVIRIYSTRGRSSDGLSERER